MWPETSASTRLAAPIVDLLDVRFWHNRMRVTARLFELRRADCCILHAISAVSKLDVRAKPGRRLCIRFRASSPDERFSDANDQCRVLSGTHRGGTGR